MFRNFLFILLLLVAQFAAVQHDAAHHALAGIEAVDIALHDVDGDDHAPAKPIHDADHCSMYQFAKQTAVPVVAPAVPVSIPPVFVACDDHSSTIIVEEVAFDWHSRAPPLFV